jgi:zinc transport system substrate-binding protein
MRYIITSLLASTTVAMAEVPRVVTDIPPVHALVSQVMGDLGTPTLLLTKGADEHDFALRPSQATEVATAELVVWIGPELTPWLDAALQNRAEGAAALALLDAEGTMTRPYAEHAEADRDATEADGHDDHDHDGTDPHAWLDPDNGKIWLSLIAAELSRLDPNNATTYATNAATATADIDTLDAEITALLAPVKDRPIVMFHDAFEYYAAQYGLTIAGTIALGDAASPGAQRLSELRATMQSGEVLCIFPEVQHDPALVAQMAEGTGARIGGALDPVGSSLTPGPGAYAELLKGMARTIADCVTR